MANYRTLITYRTFAGTTGYHEGLNPASSHAEAARLAWKHSTPFVRANAITVETAELEYARTAPWGKTAAIMSTMQFAAATVAEDAEGR